MRLGTTLALVVVFVAHSGWRAQHAGSADDVAYPDGYRAWTHVKSALVGPGHRRFETVGGFQHIYANPRAMEGYRTRVFPEGSVVVVDWLELRDNAGAFDEGPRRQLDVMIKDSLRFAATGGWLTPGQVFAKAQGIVDGIRSAAATAPIKIHKLRGNVRLLD